MNSETENRRCACVVLNYNDSETTIDFVDRIIGYEVVSLIILVDNCSTDDSYEKLKRISSRKVVVLKTEKNGGYGYGNNYGIKYAHDHGFRHVILSNPDVYFSEELIKNCCRVLVEEPNAAIVTGKQQDRSGKSIKSIAWRIPTVFEACVYPTKYARRKRVTLYDYEYVDSSPICLVDCVPGAFFVMDSDKFLAAGGFDENMFLYCEETVLGIKLKRHGFKVILLPQESYRHAHGVSVNKSIRKDSSRDALIRKNRLYIIKEYLKANRFQMAFARMVYFVAFVRVGIKRIVKRVIGYQAE